MFSSLFSFTLYFTVQYVHETPSLPHIQISCYLLAIGFWTPYSTAHFSFKLYFTVQYVGLHESPSLPHVQVSCSLLVIGFWTPCSTAHIRFILYFTVQFVHESHLLPHAQVSWYLQYWILACVLLPKSAITLYRSLYTRVAFTTARSYLLLFRLNLLVIGLSNSMFSSPLSFTL